MHIRKFDHEYSRRMFLEKTAKGILTAGVLAPMWPQIAKSADISKVYPDELMSLEGYTKGKVKTGDVISAANVDIVKDLLDPITYRQVKEMGRKINTVPTTRDVTKLFPAEHLEATIRNKGKARFDADGNITSDDGKPWIGGNPFPDPKSGIEAFSNLVISWGRHNDSLYAIRDWDISPEGNVSYQYDFLWVEQNTIGLCSGPSPYIAGKEDKLRFQAVYFTSPADTKGTAYLNTWYNDQRKFPDLIGYLPAFKRVRNFPTNQRFEPLVPGITFFLSDAWSSGDPMLTWGNYKLIGIQPMLGSLSGGFTGGRNANWEREVHGGPQGQTFFEDYKELCPECYVIECEPVGYPRAPVGKKRVWIDARSMMFVADVTYDRRGEIWKSFEPAFSQYVDGSTTIMDGKHPAWSWLFVHTHDIQSGRMSRFVQAREVVGGVKSEYNMGPEIYEKYLTEQAIRRFGT